MKNKIEESLSTWEFKHPVIPRRKRSCLESPPSVDKHGFGEERRDEDAPTRGGAVNFHFKNVEKSERFLEEVKETFRNQPEKIDAFNQVLRDLKAARAGAHVRFKELLKGHKNLLHGLKIFLLEEYGAELDKDDDPPDEVNIDDARNLQRFHKQEHFLKRFIDTIEMLPKPVKDRNEVYKEFSALFVDAPDLVEKCMKFVPVCSATSQQEPSGVNQVKYHSSGLPIPQKVSAQKQCRDGQDVVGTGDHDASSTEHPDYEDNKRLKKKKYLRRHVENENSKTSSHYQGDREMEPLFDLNLPPFPYDEEGDVPDPMDHFDQFLEQCENIESQIVGGHVKQRFTLEDENKEHGHEVEIGKKTEDFEDKYSGKTIYELDLSDCEHCTPSYRRLPENYRTLLASQRSNPGVLVLNDHCVSIEPGCEGHSFKHISNNKYEKNLFNCEDKRFELDMLLENFKSTVTCAESLLNLVIEGKIRVDGLIQLEDYFTTMNLRCIERLYGDHCLQAIDFLRQNPALALPVILTRLKRRQEEWLKCRAELNVTLADICAENDCMARDHRSMYFKEKDIKKLSAKSLIADIKELKDKRRKEDVHQAIDVDHQQPIGPHLKFKYNNASIHKDLRKLLHIQCEEMFSSEQHNRIMRLWSNFLEKFLGFYEEDPIVSGVKLDKKLNSIERNQNMLKVNSDDQRCQDAEEEDMDDAFKAQYGNGSVPVEGMKMEERLSNVKWENSYKNAEINRKASSIPAPTCLEPCAKYMPTMEEKKRDSRIFLGNDDFYVLFRLHQTLYERILLAKRKSAVADKKSRTSKDSGSLDSYARFISILCDFLKGSAENTKFENECQEIIGNSSFMLFTLDFLIGKLVKRLEVVEKNEKDNKLLEIYGYKKSSKHWYGIDTVHHKMATSMLHGRNIYRFECSSSPTRLSIELMDKDVEKPVLNG